MRLKITLLCISAFLMLGTATHASTPYTVQSGDTLWKISQKNNISLQHITRMNGFTGTLIYPGQTVYIPSSSKPYTVRSGDTLYKISSSSNVSLWAMKQENPQLKDMNAIYPGQILDIPYSAAYAQKDQISTSAYALQVSKLVNQHRQQAGLAPLTLDTELSHVALAKAKDMIQNRYFSHTSPTYGSPFEMMRSYGITYTAAGENIAKGQTSPQEVMNDWMNSDGHRANILNPHFDSIGIAYYNGAWVQLFKK
jgi:uncharacterized YkwD family protein